MFLFSIRTWVSSKRCSIYDLRWTTSSCIFYLNCLRYSCFIFFDDISSTLFSSSCCLSVFPMKYSIFTFVCHIFDHMGYKWLQIFDHMDQIWLEWCYQNIPVVDKYWGIYIFWACILLISFGDQTLVECWCNFHIIDLWKEFHNWWNYGTDDIVSPQIEYSLYLDILRCCYCRILSLSDVNYSCNHFLIST